MRKITFMFLFLFTIIGFAQSIPVDFESDITVGANWKADSGLNSVAVVDIADDDPDHGNAGQMISSASGQPWQNAQLRMTTNYIDLTTDKTITLDIYATAAQNFLLKIEQPVNGTGTAGFSEKNFSHTGSGWETLTVDFTTPLNGDIPNDQYGLVVLFPCYSTNFATAPFDSTTYVDNVTAAVGDAIAPAMPNVVTVDPAANWVAYMNWFNLPADGGEFAGGDGWGVADVKTEIGAENITLKPNYNLYGNGNDPYWANGDMGNKIMEGSTYLEPGASFNGTDLTFKGTVVSNTISDDYTVYYFIKALDPNNGYSDALGGAKVMEMPESGEFSVSATGAELAPGLVVQYGFTVYGINANPANEEANGSVVVGPASLSTETFVKLGIAAYPNPTQNVWNLSMADGQINSVAVYDVMGKKVYDTNVEANALQIDASTLPSGLYFAKITSDKGNGNIRLLKK